MDTIDQQLEAATAKNKELEAAAEAASAEINTLKAANAELKDNMEATKATLAVKEQELASAKAEVEKLKAEAKTVEQKAAEIYGAKMTQPVQATAVGDAKARPVKERFAECKTPTQQTKFIQSLSAEEREELYGGN